MIGRRQTLQVVLALNEYVNALAYEPGDHVAIFPANPQQLVERVIDALQSSPEVDEAQRLEILRERVTPLDRRSYANVYWLAGVESMGGASR